MAKKLKLLFLSLAMMAGVLGAGIPTAAGAAVADGDLTNLTGDTTVGSRQPSVSADGGIVAYADFDGSVFVEDRATGQVIEIFRGSDASRGYVPLVAADGSFIAFGAEINGRAGDVLVWDRATGAVENITAGIGQSFDHSLSADGAFVAFMSEIPLPNGVSIEFNILVWERATGEFNNISEVVGESFRPSISGDGSFVVFESPEAFSPTDTNATFDVLLWERATDEITYITEGSDAYSGSADISNDASNIAFVSNATNLTPDGLAGGVGVFLWERATDDLAEISDGFGSDPSISQDGSVVTFSTASRFAGDPTNSIFVWKSESGEVTNITEGSNGPSFAPIVSADGSVVVFQSGATNLSPDDSNGVDDVFVWEASTTIPEPPDVPEPPSTNFECSQKVVASNFDVSWSGAPEGAVRFVVKRSLYGTFWWRGAVTDGSSSFTDGPTESTSASVYYRVEAQDKDRNLIGTAGCSVVSSDDLSCTVSPGQAKDGYRVDVSGVQGANIDYVIRRTVSAGGNAFWRTATKNQSFEDSASPTGEADYVVWARDNKKIVSASKCATAAT